MKARVRELLNRRPAVGLAVGVVRDGSLELFSGHGVDTLSSDIRGSSRLPLADPPGTHDGVGVMAFTNGARQAASWLPAEVERLLGHLIGVPDEAIRTDVPSHPEIWSELCGWYRPRAQLTDMQAWSMAGAGAEVVVRRGRLVLRALSPIPALSGGFPLHPDDDKDPYAFRIDLSRFGIGTGRVVFSREPGGVETTALHLDLPMSLEKRPASKNPRLWTTGALAAAATTAVAVRRRRRVR